MKIEKLAVRRMKYGRTCNWLIHTVTMLDVIDILVVAFFLNKLYQMLKNTRAASLVKGC